MGFIYVIAFVLLVVVQFPSAGPVSARAGNVSLKVVPGPNGQGIRSIELTADGLRLVFSERYPLVLRDGPGKETRASPEAYETLESGFSLRFDDGSRLSVATDDKGLTSWILAPRSKATSASLRYELQRNAILAAPGDEGALRVTLGQVTYRVNGARLGDGPGDLNVMATRGAWRPFYAAPELADAKPVQPPAFMAQAPMDATAWERVIATWRDKAWQGLAGSSFDAATGTWKTSQDGAATGAFDEARFIAFMAEAMRRQRYEAAASLQSITRASHTESLSWRSAPFAGRTMTTMAAFEEAGLSELREMERLLQARSPSLFYRPGIVHALLDRSPYSFAKEALSFARVADFTKADTAQATALLEAYLDARDYLTDEENPFLRVIDLVDRTMAPAVRKAEGNFYLQTGSDGSCDALVGLRAGKALIRLAEATGKPLYAGIGQSLVSGILRLSDSDGSLPASVMVRDESLSAGSERLSAAAVYGLVGSPPYYPRPQSFFKQLGPGSWAWTCAPELSLEHAPDRTVIGANYPIGSTHYMALYGVRPFVKIQLYGIDYNMDPSFENYNASGYFYKRAAGAMYLKMRHKAQREDIRLYY